MTGLSARAALAPGATPASPSRLALARLSAWLGLVGFGGGIAVLATMHAALVEQRRWLSEREFSVTATISQMIPGGAAANALAYTGLRMFGPGGAVLAYAAFIAPGALVVLAFAAAYAHLGVSPHLAPVLAGMNAAVVGVVGAITLQLVRSGVSRAWQMGVAGGALLLALAGGASAGEVAALGVGAGIVLDLGIARFRLARAQRAGTVRPPGGRANRSEAPPVALPEEGERLPPPPGGEHALAPLALGAPALGALGTLGLVLFRAGLGAYGGGFAAVTQLRAAVLEHGWLTARQFADAVAIGKLTPGPVLLMATFVGYLTAGLPGALVATVAIFAGPLLLVLGIGAVLARYRSRRPVRAALRGLTPAVVGLMAAAALTLGSSLEGAPELAIAGAAFLTLARFRASPVAVMAAGGAARLALALAGR
ncbi:MAG: chromate transporter [Anaeromyxobacter sp.]